MLGRMSSIQIFCLTGSDVSLKNCSLRVPVWRTSCAVERNVNRIKCNLRLEDIAMKNVSFVFSNWNIHHNLYLHVRFCRKFFPAVEWKYSWRKSKMRYQFCFPGEEKKHSSYINGENNDSFFHHIGIQLRATHQQWSIHQIIPVAKTPKFLFGYIS